jgi:formylglycine-generating enzyme required for sulfatase activity
VALPHIVPDAVARRCAAATAWVGAWACLALGCSASSDGAGPKVGDSGVPDAESGVSGDASPCISGTGAPPPSCAMGAAGTTGCGACEESCCRSEVTIGGQFDRTYTNPGTGPAGEMDPATVTTFRLDRYEVTVGRFRQFVEAWAGGAGWTPMAGSGKHTDLNAGRGLSAGGGVYEPGWLSEDDTNVAPTDAHLACDIYSTWTPSTASRELLPINCVNWFEAYAFCIWDGGFLPSEAEWEYAAAGGAQQREYPWGSADAGTGSRYEIASCEYPSASGHCTGVANIAPVGTAADGSGLWGQLDLAGNVEEWNLDYYIVPYALGPCTDCAYLTTSERRVLRGGNFFETQSALLPQYRDASPATTRSGYYGVRCARNAQ